MIANISQQKFLSEFWLYVIGLIHHSKMKDINDLIWGMNQIYTAASRCFVKNFAELPLLEKITVLCCKSR